MSFSRLTFSAARRLFPAVLLFATACGTAVPSDAQTFNRTSATSMFAQGYSEIDDNYIEDVDFFRLTVAGLDGLSNIDPSLRVALQGNAIRLNNGDTTIGAFSAPDRDTARAWAEILTNAVSIGRNVSPALRNADAEEIYRVVFDGVLGELDRFSRYAGRDRASDHRAARDGFGGIGVRVDVEANGVRVVEVLPETPASDVNLRADDMIVRIDGVETAGLDQRGVINRLRGRIGDIVELAIRREGTSGIMSVDLRREQIIMPTVFYSRQGNAAYIRMTSFNTRTARSMAEAIEQAKREIGQNLMGYVLDLRGDPGGLLEQAVYVSDGFIEAGDLLDSRGRVEGSVQDYDAKTGDLTDGRPVVVLVNGASASAAEIVAAALQDSGRAVVIGSASYGKGSLQTVITLPNSGELTLTWARLISPSGHSFHEYGVLPNVCTANAKTSRDVISSLATITQRMRAAANLARSSALGDDAAIAESRSAGAWNADGRDIDLEVAMDLLASPSHYSSVLFTPRPALAEKPKAN
mgnify:CR=1 FL=1